MAFAEDIEAFPTRAERIPQHGELTRTYDDDNPKPPLQALCVDNRVVESGNLQGNNRPPPLRFPQAAIAMRLRVLLEGRGWGKSLVIPGGPNTWFDC